MPNFKYVEDICASSDLLNKIKEHLIFADYPVHDAETPVANTWTIHKEVTDVTSGKIKELILKGIATIGTADPTTKTFYVSMKHNFFTTPAKHSSLTLQLLDNLDGEVFGLEGYPVLFEYAVEDHTPTDRDETKPVYFYLNIMNNRLAMVAVGDPAVNFQDYKKSFMYVGALKPFKFNEYDVEGNVMLTAGAVTAEPTMASIAAEGTHYFGEYTSVGNNTLQMLKTKSGILFQRHYPAFITQAPPVGLAFKDTALGDTGLALEPQGFQASRWTGKYHLSPIYVVHPYEGYRGMFENCVAVTKHNILHLDELIIDVEGKDWNQEVYRYFDTDTPQNFMTHSPNQKMGVAILKEVRYPSV